MAPSTVNIPILGDLPSVESIQERVNKRYDEMIHVGADNKRSPLVCSVCDEFLLCRQDVSVISIDVMKNNVHAIDWDIAGNAPNAVKEQFCFVDTDNHLQGDTEWLKGIALSPRGVIHRKKNHHKSPLGFSSCNNCKKCIVNGTTPLYAIVNQNYVGNAPKCLTDLTEVELAFVSPVKGFGYCFLWEGGSMKQVRGQLTFMRVEPRKIARSVAQLHGMGLNKHMVVIISGGMTKDQKKVIYRKNLRVDKVLAAVEWLCANNVGWASVDFEKYKEELKDHVPTIVDKSTEVASKNANLENQELFSCYYPDGTLSASTGGFEDNAAFKSYVQSMGREGYNLDVKIQLGREFLKGRDGDELISSSLLQFPYGIGGLDESRVRADGTFTNRTDLEPFLSHLTKLSQPVFHVPMFQLVTYSMISRLRLLKRSKLQLKNDTTAELLAHGLRHEDIRTTAKARKCGDYSAGTAASRHLLKAVDGMSRHLPHSNEAAKTAKNTSDGMQAYFGSPHIFLTVTFDDQNGLVVQIMARQEIDDDTPVENLTKEELEERSESRRQLRLKFPGVSACHFEMMLQITVEEVCGWNMRTHSAIDVGMFGICEALAISFEEQGRKTLHAHMSLWIRHFKRLREAYYFAQRDDSSVAKGDLSTYYESICSTDFFGAFRDNKKTIMTMLDHDCKVKKRSRGAPVVISDQELRNLRHKHGYEVSGGRFATCPDCDHFWTYEQMVGAYCAERGDHDVPHIEQGEKKSPLPESSMEAKTIEFQKKRGADVAQDTPVLEINACFNQHKSYHATNCFKCQKKGASKKSHTCSPTCECRMRYPDRGRDHSQLRVLKKDLPWYSWTGDVGKKDIIQVLPKRAKYDLFQNTSCKAISESKLACNTNVQIITDGPIGQYQFKYIWKSTQDDDTAEYSHVCASIKGLEGPVHEDDKDEALRIIRRAAFAHNKANVIGAPMASYLTRHDSRFYFSHAFTYCPIRDLKRLIQGQGVSAICKFKLDGDVYFENTALHYLCRAPSLESLTPKQFYEGWYVKRLRKRAKSTKTEPIYRMVNTEYFKHPSSSGKDEICGEGVDMCEVPKRLKIPVYMFNDTCNFGGNNLLTCPETALNIHMEQYALQLLLVFTPYRSYLDFRPSDPSYHGKFPHVMRLREAHVLDNALVAAGEEPQFGTDSNKEYLQNVQDCAYNSLRCKAKGDDLTNATEAFECDVEGFKCHAGDEDDEDNEENEDGTYESILEAQDDDIHDTDATYLPKFMHEFSFDGVKNNGFDGNGYYKNLPELTMSEHVTENVAPNWVFHALNSTHAKAAHGKVKPPTSRPSLRRLVTLLITATTRRTRAEIFKYNPTAEVIEANGTIQSIFDWAEAAELDEKQRRAFEVIISAFLLTFYEDEGDITDETEEKTRFRCSYNVLMKLKGGKTTQLILLLHGPGGSGKSTVINLVRDYAKEFCHLVGHQYTIRTIVITALSGVAATLLHGETTQKSLGTLTYRLPKEDEQEPFSDTRMVLVDECSFGSAETVTMIEWRMKNLLKKGYLLYGGRNIVYAGDYSQLTPVKQTPIYRGETCYEFHGLLNCFIELDGMHRFKDDMPWGHMMYRFREGRPTAEDIDTINTDCIVTDDHRPPENVQVAVWRNQNRDAINSAIFDKYCYDNEEEGNAVFGEAMLIFMDDLQMYDSQKKYTRVRHNSVKHYFWSTCGEDGCRIGGDKGKGRVDPVLKLYPGCPLMMTENKDVPNGQANGSRVFLKKVNVKYGEQPMILTLESGTKIRTYMASQIDTLLVEHELGDIVPSEFTVESKVLSFTSKLLLDGQETKVRMKGRQFTLISNSATTGHKLQGYTATALFVMEWLVSATWMYVVLSRVKTRAGFFMKEKLTTDLTKYKMDDLMQQMLLTFQEKHGVNYFTDAEYKKILDLEKRSNMTRAQRKVLADAEVAAAALRRNNNAPSSDVI